MPLMRIIIEVETPRPFKTQKDRTNFNKEVLEKAQQAFPGLTYVATEDVSYSHVLTHDGAIPTTAAM